MFYKKHKKQSLRFTQWKRKSYAAFHSIGRHITIGSVKSIIADTLLRKQKNIDTGVEKITPFTNDKIFDELDDPLFALQLMQLAPLVSSNTKINLREHNLYFSPIIWLKPFSFKGFSHFFIPTFFETKRNNYMHKGFIVLTGLMLLITQSKTIKAQDTLRNATTLAEVIVQENRLRSSVAQQNRDIQIIDREKLERLPVRSIAELLTYVAGVDVRQRGAWGTQPDISIDGGTFDQTLVLLNGIRVTDPQTGHNMMNLPITLDVIDHIEILRGPAARVYGINALTGAINIVTKTPQKTGAKITGYAGSGFKKSETSDNLYNNWGATLTGTLAGNTATHLFSASHDNGNGYTYNTAAHNEKLFYEGKFKLPKDNQVDVMAGYVNNDFSARGFYSPASDTTSFEIAQAFLSSIGYQTNITQAWTMRPRVSYTYRQDEYQIPQYEYRNLHKNNIFNAEINNTINTNSGDIGFGVEARQEAIVSTNLGEHKRNNYGLSGEYKAAIKNFSATAGGYLNYNSDYGWQFFPGIDVGYKISRHLKVFANAGTAQRLPTFTDLYYSDRANLGNDKLVPEKSQYIEAGLKYNSRGFNASANYFYRHISNFIDYIKSSDSTLYLSAADTTKARAQNFRNVYTNGFTFNADYRTKRNETATINSILIGVGYTYLSPKIKDPKTAISYTSKYALTALRHQLQGTFSVDAFKMINLSISARYNNRISYKDYTLLDAHVHWQQKAFKLFIDITNLTNVYYTEEGASPMPGRWFQAGASITLMK